MLYGTVDSLPGLSVGQCNRQWRMHGQYSSNSHAQHCKIGSSLLSNLQEAGFEKRKAERMPPIVTYSMLEAQLKALRDLQADQRLKGFGQRASIRDDPMVKQMVANFQAGMAQMKKEYVYASQQSTFAPSYRHQPSPFASCCAGRLKIEGILLSMMATVNSTRWTLLTTTCSRMEWRLPSTCECRHGTPAV